MSPLTHHHIWSPGPSCPAATNAEQITFPVNNCISLLFFITHYKDEEINPLDVLGNGEAWRFEK